MRVSILMFIDGTWCKLNDFGQILIVLYEDITNKKIYGC